tara:strand:+ start:5863 stop:6363 length:501 start_codon:yes stop_codon:yes gene_type:complete
MNPIRLIALVAPWGVLALMGSHALGGDLASLVHVPALVFICGVPVLVAALAYRPQSVAHAFVDAFGSHPGDLPHDRRDTSVAVLRTLGGTALALGIFLVLLGMIALLNAVAASPDQAHPAEIASGVAGLMIAPLYGVAIRVFLWDPLANGLEGAGDGAGAELQVAD